MKFKKLEVCGFKSFADKLEIKFGGGVTAIVGPNGCGKSNVADSIRWVLGEQSAKLLRGSSMQDVIFNGTENRKSLSFCEVSLYFDNSEKWFSNLAYEEVVISRKLYRSGESEYSINKSPCRLKDITDHLRDAGMGREGYSIIGQGRIDELLSAKPEDRRTIFEEAAGISKFKARKLDSERKLARTRDNITRINDILQEKSRILEPLTRQSEAARKWLDLRDRLRDFEINTYIYQYDSASQAKAVINERMNALSEEIDLRERECNEATAGYNEAMQNLNSIDRNIEKLREELLTLTVGMEKQAGEVKLLNERLNYLNKQNYQLLADNKALDDEYRMTSELIEQGQGELDKKVFELERLKEKNASVSENYFKIVDELKAGEGEMESNHREMLEAMDKLSEIKSNMSRLLAEKEALGNLVADLKKKREECSSNLNGVTATVEAGKADNAALVEKIRALKSDLESLYTENNECVSGINSLAAKIDSINAKYYMAKSKQKMLKDMQEAFEGFAFSVKKLLNDSKTNPAVSERIEGVVAQLLKVDAKFETAVEMALGNAVQNIVVKTEDDAKYLIEYLKKMRYGRVTFLPMSAIKPRRIDSGYARFLQAPGVYGIAGDLISFDGKYDNIVRGLLGSTVIVEDMDVAIKLSRSTGFSFKVVTLDGDIINPHGAITGGSKKADITNIFSHDRELADVNAAVAEYEITLKECNEKRDALAGKQSELSGRLKSERESLHSAEVDLAGKVESCSKSEAEMRKLREQCDAYAAEINRHSQRIAEIETDINSVGELENIITTKKRLASDNSQERQQKFDVLRKEREQLHEELTNARLSVAGAENTINTIRNELNRLQTNLTTLSDKIKRGADQVSANDILIQQIEEELNAMTNTANVSDSSRVETVRGKLSNLDDYKRELQDKLTAVDGDRVRLMDELQSLHEKKNKEDMLLLKVDTDIEQMQQRVTEEYNLDYEQCLPFKQEGYNVEKGVAESNRIKRQMNALGHVNLDAIEQCKVEYESYHDMDVQREDLIKAEADLLKIIKELSDEMLGRFTEQFEKIRVNFIKIFKELFDGGDADLVLLESENPLDAGIEIKAQPPQKKLQSISLLSGGERALTAIAILFAILRLKPMPFCVLDEIEAALDDANAGRFAKYLRRFSEETQFIVITHRKPTMELSDNLYGVTMEEKGVSKIVSVKLSEAVAAAESAR